MYYFVFCFLLYVSFATLKAGSLVHEPFNGCTVIKYEVKIRHSCRNKPIMVVRSCQIDIQG